MTPGVVKFRDPADTIVSRFTVAWVEDKAVERKKRQLVWAMVGFAAAGLVSIMTIGARQVSLHLAVGAVAVVLAVATGYRWRAYKRLDIDDRKLQMVLRVLKILRADIPSTERVTLSVDLRDYDATASKPGPVAVFTDDWFRLTTRLADGNVVTLMLTDRIKRKTKRKGRLRFSAQSRIRVAVRLAKQYRPAASIASRLQARPERDGLRLAGVSAASESRLVVAFLSSKVQLLRHLPAGDAVLQALASVYGGIAAARRPA
jgi:hypothetical protein